tara:strand:- start:757 stop:957 length:201 start_codon:yes stop_codon:yes gene_type:complete
MYIAKIEQKNLNENLLHEFAHSHGCTYKILSKSNYKFSSDNYNYLEELVQQLSIDPKKVIRKENYE